ncbi:MAG: tail fiber domain-containing protein [Alphaproteobacteria bacterium]
MKTKLLLASASALAMAIAGGAIAENIGVGVLEPQAVLHVKGDAANADDVIFENLDAFDGTANDESVLLTDGSDGSRVKTIPLTTVLADANDTNSAFAFDDATNVLSITEGGNTLTVDLSDLQDTLNDNDTTIVSFGYDPVSNTLTIFDSALNQFDADLTELDNDTTLATTNLVQTAGDAKRTYDMNGQTLQFTNGDVSVASGDRLIFGNSLEGSDTQGFSRINPANDESQLHLLLGDNGGPGSGDSLIVGIGNGNLGEVSVPTMTVNSEGDIQFDRYGAGAYAGDAVNDSYLTVNAAGEVREVTAPSFVDTTVSNTAASLTGSVLTITDETGDVTVDIAAIDTDTTIEPWFGVDDGAAATDNNEDVYILGSVGVNTNTPTSALTVDGNMEFIGEKSVQFGDQGTLHSVTDYLNESGNKQLEVASLSSLFLSWDTNQTASDNVGVVFSNNGRFTGTGVEVARINGNGIGFGAVPAAALHIVGSTTDAADVIFENLDAFDGSADTEGLLLVDPSDNDRVKTIPLTAIGGNSDLDWAVSGTASDLATGVADNIYTNGNVGINTDTPAYPLVVDTAATQNALVVREATESGQTFGRVGVGTDTPGYSLDVAGDIRATGNVYAGDQFLASNFFQTSDRRLKTDIAGYNGGLDALRQMRTVSFRYTGEGLPSNRERLHYGVIAQEVAQIDEALVGSFTSPEDGVDYLTVNVQSMTYVLANAVQQLDAENAMLKAKLEETEARLARLEELALLMEGQLGVSDQ